MFRRSLRATNLRRKPYRALGEYEGKDLQDFFNCTIYGGWPACKDGNGKEMIRVGAIESLSVSYHSSKNQTNRRLNVDMKNIRLNHYMMRTKEDAIESARKWDKLVSRLGQIASNRWFRLVFDDSILDSKRLI